MAAGPAGSYVSGSALVVDGAQWLYKKPGVPMDVVLKESRGKPAHALVHPVHSLLTMRSITPVRSVLPVMTSKLDRGSQAALVTG